MATTFQVVFDTHDPDRQAGFWAAVLGYKLQAPPEGFASWDEALRAWGIPEERWNDATAIVDPEGVRPRLYFQRVPERKVAKNRLHLDVNVGGGTASFAERKARVDAEVTRLIALGATNERGAMERDDEYWVRMNDPEGNEFCVQ
jgi:hypothetical protein